MVADIPVRYGVTLVDSEGIKAAVTAYGKVSDAQLVSAAVVNLNAFSALIEGVTDGQILSQHLSLNAAIPGGYRSAPVEDSHAAETGVWDFTSAGAITWALAVPTLKDSLRVGGKIDNTATAAAALAGDMSSSSLPFLYTTREGVALVAFRQSFLSNRKRGDLRKRSISAGA